MENTRYLWFALGEIPVGEILYRYASPQAFPFGQEEIPNNIFNDKELSCDWEKYQKNPEKSKHISEGKTIIISIKVNDEIRNPRNPKTQKGEIVTDWKQNIFHNPSYNKINDYNYSHSIIKGSKKKAVVDILKENSTWKKLY